MLSASSKVNFFFDKAHPNIRNRKRLKLFVEFLFKQEKRRLHTINYIFCRDKRVLKINLEYLGHDYYTDIITFDFSEPDEPVVADVYISVDRVKENAVSHGTSIKEELTRVVFHGALHLCGYFDKTASQRKRIRERENYYLAKYFR